MNLYTFILVTPHRRDTGSVGEDDLFHPLGDIPGITGEARLSPQQIALLRTTVMRWFANEPPGLSEGYRCQRQRIVEQLQAGDGRLVLEYHTGDTFPLARYHEDTESLFEMLKARCAGTSLSVTRHTSI